MAGGSGSGTAMPAWMYGDPADALDRMRAARERERAGMERERRKKARRIRKLVKIQLGRGDGRNR